MIAIDDGYGDVKVGNGEEFRVIPSKATNGRVVQSRYSGGKFVSGGAPVLETEGAIFTLQDGPNAESTRFDDWPNSALNRVLCRHAACSLGMVDGDMVVTGLPMSVYFDRTGQVNRLAVNRRVESLKKQVIQETADGLRRHLAVPGRIKILPQGMAAIFDYLIQNDGSMTQMDRIGVVDVGSRTTDVAVYTITDDGEGAIEMSRSGGFQQGVSDMVDVLMEELQRSLRLQAMPLPGAAGKALRSGQFKVSGEVHNVESQRLHVMRTVIPQIMDKATHILSGGQGLAGLMDLDAILLVGGGAYMVRASGWQLWDQGRIPDAPELANVRGMAKMGMLLDQGNA
ncbi:ParM/StbA family protein [Acidithiobacillus sp. VAN18-1]|uniref:ParM/StbA family protein n=1 Tax=Igneacidithiobacillus copahuensis TaxID=2724909 RepID=A0AAE2YRX3_9PROT|nr:ParM/StbA family protein [Igneacidithiobacillus copahuensis]MBU2788670.1 ParM/StbA family protein [Igneacidithiobacillus copahuensis]MBU2796646.1 ParM/StbA family protein [Acidithiobacillus sp. VAN18-2]